MVCLERRYGYPQRPPADKEMEPVNHLASYQWTWNWLAPLPLSPSSTAQAVLSDRLEARLQRQVNVVFAAAIIAPFAKAIRPEAFLGGAGQVTWKRWGGCCPVRGSAC